MKVLYRLTRHHGKKMKSQWSGTDTIEFNILPKPPNGKGTQTFTTASHMSLVTRKPVFGVCDQIRLKPACLHVKTKDIILSKQRITKALIRLRGCAGWSAPLLFAYGNTGFLMTWLNYNTAQAKSWVEGSFPADCNQSILNQRTNSPVTFAWANLLPKRFV